MAAPNTVVDLVARYKTHASEYMAPHYNETLLRRDFLDPLFAALDWDTQNTRGYAELYREVIHEESLKVGSSSQAPDYTFRIGSTRKFFVEAKKPAVDILNNFDAASQIRRYAWSANLSLSILTNFRDLVVYDTRTRPEHGDRPSKNRILKFTCDEFVTRWDELANIFGREQILQGGFDKFVSSTPKRGTQPVDSAFLEEIDKWRLSLAKNIVFNNKLSQEDLNYAVAQTIDRIIFLRICEDRGTEKYSTLQGLAKGAGVYKRLLEVFKKADTYYNSGLFYFTKHKGRAGSPDDLTVRITISDHVLRDILSALYEPKNSYEFRFIPVEILGQVYEQFLGRVILQKGRAADVVDKPEVKKAGGVVYTPSYIVDQIVLQTLGVLCKGKGIDAIAGFKVLDPACGSGSFLLGAYNFLLDWHLQWHVKNGGAKRGFIYQAGNGEWRLSEKERRRILVDHIYGVDVDAQAVEVTKLSLVLKMLDGVSPDSISLQFFNTHEPALPDLDANIRSGNSLIAPDFYQMEGTANLSDEQRRTINAFDWNAAFPEIFKSGGFDAVIGNPPYVLQQAEFRDELKLKYFRAKYLAAFKIDLYHLFIERAFELTRIGGKSALITPSNYLTNNYMAALRRAMIETGGLDQITVIDGKVFPRRAVDTAIFVATKSSSKKRKVTVIRAGASPGLPVLSSTELSIAHILGSEEVLFTGSDPAKNALWARLVKYTKPLGAFAWVNFGKQLRDREKFAKDVIAIGAGQALPRNYKRCYTGDDIERYSVVWNNRACLDDPVAQEGGCWNPKRQDEAMKILTRQIGFWPEYAIDTSGYQCLNTIFMLNLKVKVDPYCLLGILNSKVIRAFWLDKYYDRRRTFPKIKGTYLKKLPIPKSLTEGDGVGESSAALASLRKNVQKAISLREQLRNASASGIDFLRRDSAAVDDAIDVLVYRIFELQKEDIALVEATVSEHNDLEELFRKHYATKA